MEYSKYTYTTQELIENTAYAIKNQSEIRTENDEYWFMCRHVHFLSEILELSLAETWKRLAETLWGRQETEVPTAVSRTQRY